MESEFGKGLCYCLGLFLAHTERLMPSVKQYKKMREKNPELFKEDDAAEMWFNAAADHLYELEIPKTLTKSLQTRLKKFQDKGIYWRSAWGGKKRAKVADAEWAIQEAKDLLRLIDKAHEIKTQKGTYE